MMRFLFAFCVLMVMTTSRIVSRDENRSPSRSFSVDKDRSERIRGQDVEHEQNRRGESDNASNQVNQQDLVVEYDRVYNIHTSPSDHIRCVISLSIYNNQQTPNRQ